MRRSAAGGWGFDQIGNASPLGKSIIGGIHAVQYFRSKFSVIWLQLLELSWFNELHNNMCLSVHSHGTASISSLRYSHLDECARHRHQADIWISCIHASNAINPLGLSHECNEVLQHDACCEEGGRPQIGALHIATLCIEEECKRYRTIPDMNYDNCNIHYKTIYHSRVCVGKQWFINQLSDKACLKSWLWMQCKCNCMLWNCSTDLLEGLTWCSRGIAWCHTANRSGHPDVWGWCEEKVSNGLGTSMWGCLQKRVCSECLTFTPIST
jgi:hypothetical protein